MKKYWIYIIISIATILLVSGFLIIFMPKIKLQGKDIELNVNEEYKEPGYKAYNIVRDLTNNVKIDNNLDNKKIGDYTEKYSINYLFFNISKNRNIKVVDREKPVIELQYNDKEICRYNLKKYKYKATDNYDGDITDKVEISLENNVLTYSAIDSSNNKETITKNVKIMDTKPSIKLTSGKDIYITEGTTYKEPGYKADDKCDGDLTDKVVIEGTVNTKKIGTYKIKYIVKNKDEKEATITRNVHVIKKQNIKLGTVYLTFDDGPSYLTPKFLNILDKYNVKATFFVTNQFKGQQYLIKEEFKRGHAIGVHTYTHSMSWNMYDSVNSYVNDFNLMNNIIEKQIGSKVRLFRFPGGSSNTVSVRHKKGVVTDIAKYMESKGYVYFDWNVNSGDAEGYGADGIYNSVVNGVHKNGTAVVLCHDIKESTLQALPRILDKLTKEGYTFAPLTETSPTMHQHIAN